MNTNEKSIADKSVMVKIHGLSFFEGHGVGRSEDGKVYFVDQACPGDVLEVEPYKETKSYSFARILKTIESSPQRVTPACEVFEKCGGCSIQHVDYTVQTEFKQKTLERYVSKKNEKREALKTEPIKLDSFEVCENIYNYRDRTEVHVKNGKWGFYEKKSHALVFPKECKVLNPLVSQQLNIKFPEDGHYHVDKHGIQNRSRGAEGVFDQINPEINLKLKNHLLKTVQSFSNQITEIYDLFSGNGNYTLFLAPALKDIKFTAVELSRNLVSEGRSQSQNNPQIEWVCSDVTKFLNYSKERKPEESLVIINPPRDGLDKALIASLIKLNPKYLIYISCNPMTLFRDIDALSPKLTLTELKGFDMFPQTMHFESLALLTSS
jgi:23S rRNA (uracil1939-C5)-methyltransferase